LTCAEPLPSATGGRWSKVGSGRGGRSAVPWTRRSAQTARFTGSSTTAAAGNPDQPGRIVGPGRCGPESFSNHIDLPLGTGPLLTGSAKKDALRRCITTRAIGTCECVVISLNTLISRRCKRKFAAPAVFLKKCRASTHPRPRSAAWRPTRQPSAPSNRPRIDDRVGIVAL